MIDRLNDWLVISFIKRTSENWPRIALSPNKCTKAQDVENM